MVFPSVQGTRSNNSASSINAHGDDGYPGNAGDGGATFHAGGGGYVFAPATRVRHDAGDAHRDYADAHVPSLRERARGHASPSSAATHQLA